MCSPDRDSTYNALKISAIIIDTIHWCCCAAFLCLCIWISIDAKENFLSGTTSVLYCCMALSCLMFVAATILLIGLAADSKDIVSSYVGLISLVFILQIGLLAIMAFLFEVKQGMIKKLWFEVGYYWKDLTQSSLQCCGYRNSNEYSPMRESCLNENRTVYTETCPDAIVEYFTSPHPYAQLVTCLILPALLQIAAFCIALVILKKLANQTSQNQKWDSNGSPRGNKNQVVPLMMAPLPDNNNVERGGAKTKGSKTQPQGSNTQTPISRDQVYIGEGLTTSPPQHETSSEPSTTLADRDQTSKTARDKVNPLLNVASALLTMRGGYRKP